MYVLRLLIKYLGVKVIYVLNDLGKTYHTYLGRN